MSRSHVRASSAPAAPSAQLFTFNDRHDTTITGSLESETQIILHAFTAPIDGSLFISPDIGTSATVSLLDSDQNTLLSVGSFFLAHPVCKGETYFVRVSMAVGNYAVSLSVRP